MIDNDYKLLRLARRGKPRYELYNLAEDQSEQVNLLEKRPEIAKRLQDAMTSWRESVQVSVAGGDYPEKKVLAENPQPRFWMDVDAYRPYFDQWKERPEYASRLNKKNKKKKKTKQTGP